MIIKTENVLLRDHLNSLFPEFFLELSLILRICICYKFSHRSFLAQHLLSNFRLMGSWRKQNVNLGLVWLDQVLPDLLVHEHGLALEIVLKLFDLHSSWREILQLIG